MRASLPAFLSAAAVLLAGLGMASPPHVARLAVRRSGEPVPEPFGGRRGLHGRPRSVVDAVGDAVGAALRRPRRTERRLEQLADALVTMASVSRTGLSLTQAIEAAAGEVADPLGAELRAVVDRARMGMPLEEALARWAAEAPSPEVRLAVGVLRMHRAVGEAIVPALENLVRTVRERRSAARELRSLTAQARLSGAILGCLPLGFFAFLSLTARRDVALAVRTPLGRGAIAAGLLLDALAFAWIRRLLRVEP